MKSLINDTIYKLSLILPPLDADNIISFKAGVRPYRKSGIRIEPEYWRNKLIIHDYGHGGSGISLSWGSARLSYQIFEDEIYKGISSANREVAIVGSGIIGLTTAHLLVDNGWNVCIYADRFPPRTTSDLAPGLWNKVVVGNQSEYQIELLDYILRESFKDFDRLSKESNPRFRGVSPLTIYTFKEDPPIKNLPKGLFPIGVPMVGSFHGGAVEKAGMQFTSFLVDTSIYMADLYSHAKERGVKFQTVSFQTKDELCQIPESIIFNCTGYGAKHLFSDPDLIPVSGQLIELKSHSEFNYMLAGPLKGILDHYIIPIHDKIILGGSYEYNVEQSTGNVQLCRQILEHVSQFYCDTK